MIEKIISPIGNILFLYMLMVATEIRERRRKEKIEFEEGVTEKYRKIVKIVKWVVVIVMLVGCIGFGSWASRSINFEEIMDTLKSYTGMEEEIGTEISTEIVNE